MGLFKIHQQVVSHEDEPIDVTGVMSCHWCESREAKCIQTFVLFAFFGFFFGFGITALLSGELYFCLMLLFVGFFPIFLLVLYFIFMRIQRVKHSQHNSQKVDAVKDDKQLTDILISNEKPNSDQCFGFKMHGRMELIDSPAANDPPPEYDEAISDSESKVLGRQVTTV